MWSMLINNQHIAMVASETTLKLFCSVRFNFGSGRNLYLCICCEVICLRVGMYFHILFLSLCLIVTETLILR